MAKKQNKKETIKLNAVLVLNRFLLSLFGVKKFEELAASLLDENLERYDENNISHYYYALKSRLYNNPNFTSEQLLGYDQNIYRCTAHISEKRNEMLRWKYFQYLSLLFTEIYLDRYFASKEALLDELNEFLENKKGEDENYAVIDPFTLTDLNKLAFWNATGSGKTLITHANILQYQDYAKRYGRKHNRVILLTPNEALSKQHFEELEISNIPAQLFSKSAGGLFYGNYVEVIDIKKLADKDGDKTVAIGSFEGSNLVLVDEGHKGSGGEVWKGYRDALCADGFSFEYSATFGQSVGAVSDKKKRTSLMNEYGKAILFDYSYRYFYGDGYGKDYRIMNIKDDKDDNLVTLYLTACMLNIYEQQLVFGSSPVIKNEFLVAKPLAIFVGSSVTKELSEKDTSDVVNILKFFQRFVASESESKRNIIRLLGGEDGLIDNKNRPIFNSSFKHIREIHKDWEVVYSEVLRFIFNSNISGAKLHLDNLKGQTGEIGLRIGNGEYFGVINVGDDSKLIKMCEKHNILTDSREFSQGSLFHSINNNNSTINILIGSKKFSEGWSSWRVSTMGLMNVGQGEGSQIIQLFGRGVRLRGYNQSLKRSSKLDKQNIKTPKHLTTLETLNIFGIRADYMEQFKKYLDEEGMAHNDSSYEEITIPMMPTANLSGKQLKYIKVKDGKDFKKEVVVSLTDGIGKRKIAVDWYPKVQLLRSGNRGESTNTVPNETVLSDLNLAFVDWDSLYFNLQRLKSEKAWYNFEIDYNKVKEIANDKSWYQLLIPANNLLPTDFGSNTRMWQEIITSLMRHYLEKVYNRRKAEWMAENVETAILDESHPNFTEQYTILVNRDLDRVVDNLNNLKTEIASNTFIRDIAIDGANFNALYFEPHLYQPLLYLNKNCYKDSETSTNLIEIKPVSLNEGEQQFVLDLKEYHQSHNDFFKDKELYLLRNQSRKGIGFFEANNFYPDFILWIVTPSCQYISFIDPKGLRQIGGLEDPKIELHKVIRETIEPRLEDTEVKLNSFIVTPTTFDEVRHWGGSITTCNTHNVYFQEDQKNSYIDLIINKILNM